jgi:UDP-glucuronate 4-epimerase
MNKKKILITGSAGFIGFHAAKFLLSKNFKVYGIDNLDDYYDVRIKKQRLSILNKNNLFKFCKFNILNYNKLKLLFKKNKFTYVLHLAAQAGVRYSFINPKKYIDTNINGFFNVINLSNEYKIKHFVYASSSSVYGLHKNKVSKEADDVNHPTSLYGATKRSNELIAHTYSHLHDLRTSGLRFFTVYGQYGRPDMSIFKFFKNNITNKKNFIFNYGNHQRSFTYIDDVVSAIYKIIVKKNKKSKKKLTKLYPDENLKNNFNIINVGNDQVVKLSDVIQKIENITKKKFKNLLLPLQKGDVIGSKASSKKLKNNFDFKFKTNISSGLKLFYKWFLNYKEFNINLKSK